MWRIELQISILQEAALHSKTDAVCMVVSVP